MKAMEWTFRDKSDWGNGPWQTEPDKAQWIDESTGLPCLMVRGPSGALCGYVGVSSGHPAFEKHYDSVLVDTHWGLTFSSHCQEDHEHGVCHRVEAGEDDNVWWLGFDCAHSGDLCPAHSKYNKDFERRHPRFAGMSDRDEYRSVDFVRNEVRKLAAQLRDLGTIEPNEKKAG